MDISKCRTPTECPPKAKVCTTTLHSVDLGKSHCFLEWC
ncbi:hypothetical protein CIB84_014196 [Bambusicola thoracicus]|uniref:Uncharacterized protein n=1 Tax=Bambusicola thoracicus TaxID=9083 RepID=A0A2P4SD88_BAMTH|nr:hypothetical protein CIB84_014196 [Bambusicola thoracicus]